MKVWADVALAVGRADHSEDDRRGECQRDVRERSGNGCGRSVWGQVS